MDPRFPPELIPEPEVQIVPPDPKPNKDEEFWRRNSGVPLDELLRRPRTKTPKPLPN